jgi:hypothetical protein
MISSQEIKKAKAVAKEWQDRASRIDAARAKRLSDEPEPGYKMASWSPPPDWGEPNPHDRSRVTSPSGLAAELLSFPKVSEFVYRLLLPTLHYDG